MYSRVLVNWCPHCNMDKVAHTIHGHHYFQGTSSSNKNMYWLFLICPNEKCGGASVASVTVEAQSSDGFSGVSIMNFFPERPKTETPEMLDEKIAEAFEDGEKCRLKGIYSAACSQYRRALELGMKELAPEISAWKLEKRINALAKEHKLTPAIKDWAHLIRLDANEAIHGDAAATKELTLSLKELTKYTLIYLHTLPKKIEEAKSKFTEQQ